MTKNLTEENDQGLLATLRRGKGRWRFILLFLAINLLLFILIWLSWQNQKLVRRVVVLETRLVDAPNTRVAEAVATCQVDCTDRMSTVAAEQRRRIAQVTAAIGALVTRSPVAGTPTVFPVQTATPPSTYTPTPSPAPSTPTHTPTGTPAPPTPTTTYTPTPKPPPPKPQQPPKVFGITPAATVRSSAAPTFPITITGDHFAEDVTAWLGEGIQFIDTKRVSRKVITGKLSPDLPVGIYGLTVKNPGLDPGKLPPAFTVYDPYGDPIPLQSPYLVTFGRDAPSPYGTPWYWVQLVFFDVPAYLEEFEVYIFDADTGGKGDQTSWVDADQGDGFETKTLYTLYGSKGAYTAEGVREPNPSSSGIISGTPLVTATVGISNTLDGNWNYRLGSFSPDSGEPVGDRYVFKLVVEGQNGNDANWYRVGLKTLSYTDTVPSDLQIFAFSWRVLVDLQRRPHLHPYVAEGVTDPLRLQSMGCQSNGERLLIRTPFQELSPTCEGGRFTSPDILDVDRDEDGMTWAADLSDYPAALGLGDHQYLVLWFTDESGSALPIFIRPTTKAPP
jgi:hypothetical protein